MKLYWIYAFVIIFSIVFGAYMHERVHLAINDLYNAETGGIHIDLIGFYVNIDSNKCNDSCKSDHNLNDAIGYNLDGLFFLIAVGFLCIIKLKEERFK